MWQHSISFSNSVGWKVSLYPLVECLCCFRGVEEVCFPVGSDAQTSRVAQGECDSCGIKSSLNVLEHRSLLGQARTHVGEEQDSVAIELYAFLLRSRPPKHTLLVLIAMESSDDGSWTLSQGRLRSRCTVRSIQLRRCGENIISNN